MKDIYRECNSNSPDLQSEFRSQSAPSTPSKKDEKPKVVFPTEKKKVENASIGPDGKHKPKKPISDKQPTLWKAPN